MESTKLNCLIYADDLLHLSENDKGLQSCLLSLQSYCDRWRLKVNIDKAKVKIFSSGKLNTASFRFTIYGKEIEIAKKYEYLGIIIHYNAYLKHAAEHMYQKSLKGLFSLRSKIFDFDVMNNPLKLKSIDSITANLILWLRNLGNRFQNQRKTHQIDCLLKKYKTDSVSVY